MIISLGINFSLALLLYLLRNYIALAYTSDEDLLKLLDDTLPFLAIHVFFDMT